MTRIPLAKQVLPLVIGGICLWLVAQRCEGMVLADIVTALKAVPGLNWIVAMAATGVSFWAVGRYDAVMHRHMKTEISARHAAWGGRAAIAVGQTVGFGLVTGALVRWKWFEARLSGWKATELTLAVTALFLGCWAVVTLLTLPLWAAAPVGPVLSLLAGLWTLGAFVAISLLRPGILSRVNWPSVIAILRLLAWTAMDVVAAAIALWVLLPDPALVSFAIILPVYLLALGAALLTGTPGGLGPFEMTLLASLPMVPDTDIVAACVAFRLIYYAIPAGIAGIALTQRHFWPIPEIETPKQLKDPMATVYHSDHAELCLITQPEKELLGTLKHRNRLVVEQTDQALVALFDPVDADGERRDALRVLVRAAETRDRIPMLYKCDGRMALAARRRGFTVLPFAEDALIEPATFDLSARTHRQLRRKLRKAEQAGVAVTDERVPLPVDEMRRIANDWAEANGGERGFSMNRFATAPLGAQEIMVARVAGEMVGFATFHRTATGWALDLIRQTADAPDGTMHALVSGAIARAAAEGATRFSLASAPLSAAPYGLGPVESLIHKALQKRLANPGLRQFKAAFAPRWERRYIAAPNTAYLAIAGFDVAKRVAPAPGDDLEISDSDAHHHYEDYEIAS